MLIDTMGGGGRMASKAGQCVLSIDRGSANETPSKQVRTRSEEGEDEVSKRGAKL